jgi:hypothetical protein
MLSRNPISEAVRARQRAKQKRYRLRRVYGQSVHRVTTNDERVIDLLVAKGFLPNNVVHDRPMIERALTKFIDDETRKIFRYR